MLVEDASVDGYGHATRVGQIVIPGAETNASSAFEHALDTAPLSVDKVQLDHCVGQERVAVDGLGSVLPG